MRQRQLAWTILVLACLAFAASSFRSERHALASRDFKPVYAASACLREGCQLYNNQDLLRVFLEHGGGTDDLMPFRPYYLGYPPSALFFTVPFTAMSWPAAHAVWVLLLIAALCAAVVCVGELCFEFSPVLSAVLLAAFLFSSKLLILLGQPTTLVVAFCCFGTWCFLRRRLEKAGVLSFALSLVFKPHFAVFLLLYFVLARADLRKRVLHVVLAAILLALPGLVWATLEPANHHWLHQLSVSLAGIAAPGNLSDPGPGNPEAYYLANLQSLVSLARNAASVYNPVSYALCAVLLFVWLVPVVRAPDSFAKDLFCLASVAALSMLPLYHRVYDTRILLLCFPAMAYLAGQRRTVLHFAAPALTAFVTLMTFSQVWQGFGLHRVAAVLLHATSQPSWRNIWVSRPVPIACLLMAAFYLVCSYRLMFLSRQGVAARMGSYRRF